MNECGACGRAHDSHRLCVAGSADVVSAGRFPRAWLRCGWPRSLGALGALACALTVGLGSATPAGASQFGEEGSGAGRFKEPWGVAIDQSSGDLYVVDRNNQRVEKLEATGGFLTAWGWGVADGTPAAQTCTATCFAGIEGAGAGQLSFAEGVAVDDSGNPLDASVGDVYVVDTRNDRVEKFSPSGAFLLMFGGEVNETTKGDVCLAGERCKAGVAGTANGQFELGGAGGDFIAVGPTGTVYVGDDNRVQELSPEGAYQSQIALAGAGATTALAVDSAGDLYIKSEDLSGVREYSPAGTPIGTLDAAGDPRQLALDPESHLFVNDDNEQVAGRRHRILEYDASGNELASFPPPGGGAEIYLGIAFGDATGQLYATGVNDVVQTIAPPSPGPLIEPESESAAPVGQITATLGATVDPEGHETTYHFEYGPTASYGSSTPQSAPIGAGFEDQGASAALSALAPGATYHYRIVASSSAGTTDGPDQTFTTLPPALIDGETASGVTSDEATLEAQINPLGSSTTYHFEYGPTASYGTSVPVPDGELGAGTSDVTVSARVRGLAPGGAYHFRVAASNALGAADGQDQSFTTQTAGEFALPDGRRWEMVSPPDKHGAEIASIGAPLDDIQASADGGRMTFLAYGPVTAEPQGNPQEVQVLATRGPAGWTAQDIATPHAAASGITIGQGAEYRLFSSDLSAGIVEPIGQEAGTPLSSEASERTSYLRNDDCGTQQQCEVAHVPLYEPLLTSVPGYADVPAGTRFGGDPTQLTGASRFLAATPDLSHVALASEVALTATTPPATSGGLYEWSAAKPPAERLELISVLPGASATPATSPALGYEAGEEGSARYAISNDGARVVWSAAGHLYLRDTAMRETIELDAPEHGAEGGEGVARFQIADSEGSRIFFTDTARLTPSATSRPGEPDLYVYEVTSRAGQQLTGGLTDLTAHAGGAAAVQGAAPGAGEDGSRIYFVAHGALTSAANAQMETAVAGADNLYVRAYDHSAGEWLAPELVAVLGAQDAPDWIPDLGKMTARVSPDGRYLAFMSDRRLTGYDNSDLNSGKPDEEVFLYDGDSQHLLCASCNPTGMRPLGIEYGTEHRLVGGQSAPAVWPSITWLAAVLPTWTPATGHTTIYQSRYLSDQGRLFFNSSDALVPQDTNGQEDVYEYEPAGVGGCRASSETFSATSQGCVALISAGTSPAESAFLDASESGDDVFFLTASQLVPQDVDTSLDVYDAHVCSSAAPCAAAPTSSPPCATIEACRAAPSPQPALFGAAPGSATFSGAENLPAPAPTLGVSARKSERAACKRGFVRAKVRGKARCVRRRRHPARAGRARRTTAGRRR